MIKVLQVYRTYFPDSQGGGEEAVRQICLNSAPHGIEHRIFTPSANPVPAMIDRPEGQVHRVKLNFEIASCGFCLTGLKRFMELVDWADVVHYHFPWPFADLMHFLTGVKKPTVITYHSDIIRQEVLLRLYGPLMKRFLASIDRVVCTSPHYLESSATLQRLAAKTTVIPLAINEQSYPLVDSSTLAAVRSEFGEDFFLFVGVLRYYKGLHVLLNAVRDAHFKVVIVGMGPLEQELKARAAELSLSNVVFAGYVSDEIKVAMFKLCRAVVFPSHERSEAFGVTLLEGSMFAKPLISADNGTGTVHVNIDGRTGIVVRPGDPVSLRSALDRMNDDIEYARNCGREARNRYDALFDGTLMGVSYADLYRELVPHLGHTAVEP